MLTEILQGGDNAGPAEEIACVQRVTPEDVQNYMKTARLSVVYLLAGEQKGE